MKPRFLLDEHVWHGLIGLGQDLGVDVVAVQSVLPRGTPDEDVLRFAAGENRVLLTSNARDFAPLAIDWFLAGRYHAGIVIVPGKTDRKLLSKAVRSIARHHSADHFANTYRFVQEFL